MILEKSFGRVFLGRAAAGRPLLPVTVILVQIAVSLVLVGVLARRRDASTGAWSVDRQLTPNIDR